MNQEVINEIYQCISHGETYAVLNILSEVYLKNPTSEYDLFSFVAAFNYHQIKSVIGHFDFQTEIDESIKLINRLLTFLNKNDKNQSNFENLNWQDSQALLNLIGEAKQREAIQILLKKSDTFPAIIRNRIIVLSYKEQKIDRWHRNGLLKHEKDSLFRNQINNELLKLIDALKDIEKYEKYNLNSLVFVVISFKPEMNPIYKVIKKIGRKHNLKAIRVKDVDGDYKITDKIMKLIANSYFVIADLSLERPNVYYELGYARGIGKKVITLCNKKSKVHFDVQGWKCLYYTDKEDLSSNLNQAINSIIKGNDLEF